MASACRSRNLPPPVIGGRADGGGATKLGGGGDTPVPLAPHSRSSEGAPVAKSRPIQCLCLLNVTLPIVGGRCYVKAGTWAGSNFWVAPRGVPTSAPWWGSSMRWRRPWTSPATLCHQQSVSRQATVTERKSDPHQIHLLYSWQHQTRMWNFPERVSVE